MARIEGVDLPRNKRIEVALTYIFGIGPTRASEIIAGARVNPDTRVKDLTETEVGALRDYIGKNFKVEGDLRREVQMNIKRLIEIGCYRGMRHRRNLPAHGHAPARTHVLLKAPRRLWPVAVAVVEQLRSNLDWMRVVGRGALLPRGDLATQNHRVNNWILV
jgi:small subunit ribosomal protein S13